MQLRPHHPALALLAPLLPVIDIRAGSRHPLAWQGGDYLAELRAAWRADSGRFERWARDGLTALSCRVMKLIMKQQNVG